MIIKRGYTKLPETLILTKPFENNTQSHYRRHPYKRLLVFTTLYSLHKIWKFTRPCEKVEYISMVVLTVGVK